MIRMSSKLPRLVQIADISLARMSRPDICQRYISPAIRLQSVINQRRFNSSNSDNNVTPSKPGSSVNQSTEVPKPAPGTATIKMDKPSYHLSFTCKKCKTRSGHVISKQAYHGGSVLIQCPGCKVRHLIADHLKIFSDEKVTLEDIMAQKGQSITKGTASVNPNIQTTVNESGDIEIEPSTLATEATPQLESFEKEKK